ncbi:hypothetical protein IC757_09540 [Wenzhouxiangella sp. AB-CW3]|uniref:hypothetical protein n=1 Tax=Wenzhouxiangella sp. AB-CW3 TaxID=2771012 RepID=UPI00168B2B7F|nr:hypothetical protein [Wenzhouxiangella sp. AB-CW3]QOC21297.1 hypothetical protein IC757_09540 [Wenzhouxiangella sp. AB-CW3]
MSAEQSRSIDDLLQFLKSAGMEGLINPAVARARRNAIAQLSAELTERERADVSSIDVDDLASRFHKLEGASIRVETLSLYAERFRMALTDFLSWLDDPAAFSSVGGERKRAITRGTLSREQEVAERITLEASDNQARLVPIPLRPDLTVHVANLPIDLTEAEAERVVRVVRAYASKATSEDNTGQGG